MAAAAGVTRPLRQSWPDAQRHAGNAQNCHGQRHTDWQRLAARNNGGCLAPVRGGDNGRVVRQGEHAVERGEHDQPEQSAGLRLSKPDTKICHSDMNPARGGSPAKPEHGQAERERSERVAPRDAGQVRQRQRGVGLDRAQTIQQRAGRRERLPRSSGHGSADGRRPLRRWPAVPRTGRCRCPSNA